MRQYAENGQEVTNQMASGVAKKGAGPRIIVRQKTEQSAGDQKSQRRHQILGNGGPGRDQPKPGGPDRPKSRAQSVHVVHEIKGVNDG